MHNHASCLINYNDVLILIENIQRNILRKDLYSLGLRNSKLHQLASSKLIICLPDLTSRQHHTVRNQLLDMRPGEIGLVAGYKYIQALLILVSRKLNNLCGHVMPPRCGLLKLSADPLQL